LGALALVLDLLAFTMPSGASLAHRGAWSLSFAPPRTHRSTSADASRGATGGAQQEMVDPQPRIALAAVAEAVPEGIDRLVRIEFANRVRPDLFQELATGGAALRLEPRIFVIGSHLINVGVWRDHVKIAHQHNRRAGFPVRTRVRDQPVEPGQLAGEANAVDDGLDIAASLVIAIAGQRLEDQHRLGLPRQQRHAIAGALAGPHDAIAHLAKLCLGEQVGGTFSSCGASTSGFAFASHCSSNGNRPRTPFMFQVAIYTQAIVFARTPIKGPGRPPRTKDAAGAEKGSPSFHGRCCR